MLSPAQPADKVINAHNDMRRFSVCLDSDIMNVPGSKGRDDAKGFCSTDNTLPDPFICNRFKTHKLALVITCFIVPKKFGL